MLYRAGIAWVILNVLLALTALSGCNDTKLVTCWGHPPYLGWITKGLVDPAKVVYGAQGGCEFDDLGNGRHYVCYRCTDGEDYPKK